MSAKELQALTQKFADAFDQRDVRPILDMLSEDVEVFDHVPYRFDGKALFAKYLNEVIASLASASFGFRQPSCRMYSDEVGIVNAHDIILGAIFEVSDTVAAEVLEITPDNFRQRLARARRDLRNFMSDKCGLGNQANPCRCAKKTRGFIQAGYVDPENLLFVRERIGEVREAAPKVHEALSTLDEKCAEIFRGHPFYKAPDLAAIPRPLGAGTHITN